ncbi:MAG TPA: TetR/AcrR family transcriptional regulator [Solirubrobacterales bacterium]|jgi:AcrR family transcriptional regulator|nr:TetR/AcrR family transcriptional regulator [Solirubrobacterales bacterium]
METQLPRRLSEQSADHRTRLLEGLAESIRARGLSGTTVADVVRAARVSRRTFYEHFDDLVDAYLALMTWLGDDVLRDVQLAIESDGTTDERIDRAVARYLERLDEEPELARSYWLEYHLTGERGRGGAVSNSERTAELFGQLAQELRAGGEEAREPLPFEAMVMLTGSIREIVLRQFERERPASEVFDVVSWMVRLVATSDPPAS